MLLPTPDDIPQSFPGYVFELRCILSRCDVPCGTREALPHIASELAGPTDLRISLERILRAIILREGGNLSSTDLLSMLISAAGAGDQPPSARMEQACFQILGFLLEVRHSQKQLTAVPNQSASSAPSPYTRILTDSAPLAEDAVLFSPGSSNRINLIIAAGVPLLALIIALALHSHSTYPHVGASVHTPAVHGVPEARYRPAATRRSAYPHRSSLFRSLGNTPANLIDRGTEPNQPGSFETSLLADHNGESGAVRTGVAPRVPAVRPVYLGTSAAATSATNTDTSTMSLRPALIVRSYPNTRELQGGVVRSASSGIMAGNILSSPTPRYPSAATAARVEGEVIISALVGKDGSVTSARVVSGPALLREAALGAVEQWQYRPYIVDGQPAAIATTAIISFQLAHS